jgi:hypothetical protein
MNGVQVWLHDLNTFCHFIISFDDVEKQGLENKAVKQVERNFITLYS